MMTLGTEKAFELSLFFSKKVFLSPKGTQSTPKGRHFRLRGHQFRSEKNVWKGIFAGGIKFTLENIYKILQTILM